MKNSLFQTSFPIVALLIFAHCSGGSGGGGGGSPAVPGPACAGSSGTPSGSLAASGTATDNVLPIGVGTTSLCGQNINIPCTSVTICEPGTTNHCQTISDILVDTGSYGLRIFTQAMSQSLCTSFTQVTDGSGNPIGECATFGIGADWGAVMKADVQLGSEKVIHNLPIQVINPGFALVPGDCSGVDTSPAQAGYNGIMGVGLLAYDCGTECVSSSQAEVFWTCNGGNCSPTTLALNQQVKNPVTSLTADGAYTDSNGVIIDFSTGSGSTVGVNGAASVTGSLYLGVATGRANNAISGSPTAFAAGDTDNFPYIDTAFPVGAAVIPGFLDTGSNGLYFSDGSIPSCPSNSQAPGFFCPANTTALSATNSSGADSGTVNFSIANASTLAATGNAVFTDIGADTPISGTFDFGFPFFLGKRVYLVNQLGTSAPLGGAGPTWAY
jgi:hypothetical protein